MRLSPPDPHWTSPGQSACWEYFHTLSLPKDSQGVTRQINALIFSRWNRHVRCGAAMIYLPVTVLLWGGSALVCWVAHSFVFASNAGSGDPHPSFHWCDASFLLYLAVHTEGGRLGGLAVCLPFHLRKRPLGWALGGEVPGDGHGDGRGSVLGIMESTSPWSWSFSRCHRSFTTLGSNTVSTISRWCGPKQMVWALRSWDSSSVPR